MRAWKYVVADLNAEEGWRLLTWDDLKKHEDLAGDVPLLPADWKGRDPTSMSVDEVELKLEAFPIRTSLPGGELPGRWCIASAQNESGWRPLLWSDLTKEKLGGLEVPALPGGGSKDSNLSVDEVEKQLEKAENDGAKRQAKQGLDAVRMVFATLKRYSDVRDAMDRLNERLTDRALHRSVRKLIIPSEVSLVFKSNRTTNTHTMTREANNEFTGNFGELKESVTYTVRGEDYITSRRSIDVVDRPGLEKLESEEERPAYLYYRPAKDGSPADLRGKRQLFVAMPMSISGEATTIDVPAGTTLTLIGTATKDIRKVVLYADAKDRKDLVVEEPELVNSRTFRARVPNVRRDQRFTFRFTNIDDVTAERKVVINPREDSSPRVREFNPDEVIRRVKETYVIAAGCRIPFKAKVRDEQGLARVRYACRVIPADFLSERKRRSLDNIGALPLLGPGSPTQFQAMAFLIKNNQIEASIKEEAMPEQLLDIPAFQQAIDERRHGDDLPESLELGTVMSLLKEKKREPYRRLLNEFTIKPDLWTNQDEDPTNPSRWVSAENKKVAPECDLPLWELFRDRDQKEKGLKNPPNSTKPQRRYLLEVAPPGRGHLSRRRNRSQDQAADSEHQPQWRDVHFRRRAGERIAGQDRRGGRDEVPRPAKGVQAVAGEPLPAARDPFRGVGQRPASGGAERVRGPLRYAGRRPEDVAPGHPGGVPGLRAHSPRDARQSAGPGRGQQGVPDHRQAVDGSRRDPVRPHPRRGDRPAAVAGQPGTASRRPRGGVAQAGRGCPQGT